MAEYIIGAEVTCSDGVCGELRRVVIDPVARVLPHLVVGLGGGMGGMGMGGMGSRVASSPSAVGVVGRPGADCRLAIQQVGYALLMIPGALGSVAWVRQWKRRGCCFLSGMTLTMHSLRAFQRIQTSSGTSATGNAGCARKLLRCRRPWSSIGERTGSDGAWPLRRSRASRSGSRH